VINVGEASGRRIRGWVERARDGAGKHVEVSGKQIMSMHGGGGGFAAILILFAAWWTKERTAWTHGRSRRAAPEPWQAPRWAA